MAFIYLFVYFKERLDAQDSNKKLNKVLRGDGYGDDSVAFL